MSSLHKSRSALTPPAFCFSFSTIHPKGTGQSKIKLGEEQILAELTPKPWVHLAEVTEDPQSPEVTAAEKCHATPRQQAYNPNGSILCPTGGAGGGTGTPPGVPACTAPPAHGLGSPRSSWGTGTPAAPPHTSPQPSPRDQPCRQLLPAHPSPVSKKRVRGLKMRFPDQLLWGVHSFPPPGMYSGCPAKCGARSSCGATVSAVSGGHS